ncbi:hypothetical protein Tco_1129287 [Tanacetum coccineum]
MLTHGGHYFKVISSLNLDRAMQQLLERKRSQDLILDTCTSTECSSLQRRPYVETGLLWKESLHIVMCKKYQVIQLPINLITDWASLVSQRSRRMAFDTPTTTKSSLPQKRPCVRNQAPSNGKGIADFDFIDGDDRLDQHADTENDSCRAHANMYLEHLPSKGKCFEPDNTSSDLHDATACTHSTGQGRLEFLHLYVPLTYRTAKKS